MYRWAGESDLPKGSMLSLYDAMRTNSIYCPGMDKFHLYNHWHVTTLIYNDAIIAGLDWGR